MIEIPVEIELAEDQSETLLATRKAEPERKAHCVRFTLRTSGAPRGGDIGELLKAAGKRARLIIEDEPAPRKESPSLAIPPCPHCDGDLLTAISTGAVLVDGVYKAMPILFLECPACRSKAERQQRLGQTVVELIAYTAAALEPGLSNVEKDGFVFRAATAKSPDGREMTVAAKVEAAASSTVTLAKTEKVQVISFGYETYFCCVCSVMPGQEAIRCPDVTYADTGERTGDGLRIFTNVAKPSVVSESESRKIQSVFGLPDGYLADVGKVEEAAQPKPETWRDRGPLL